MESGIEKARRIAKSSHLHSNFGRPMDSEIHAAQLVASIAIYDQLVALGEKLDRAFGNSDDE